MDTASLSAEESKGHFQSRMEMQQLQVDESCNRAMAEELNAAPLNRSMRSLVCLCAWKCALEFFRQVMAKQSVVSPTIIRFSLGNQTKSDFGTSEKSNNLSLFPSIFSDNFEFLFAGGGER